MSQGSTVRKPTKQAKGDFLQNQGKQAKAWLKIRRKWILANPPSHENQYVCGICGKTVIADEMELDHISPRSGSPASFADFSNLQPSHSLCNQLKASRRPKPKISKAEYEFRAKFSL